MEKETENNSRTRVKLTQSTKGIVTWEISSEYDTPEKAIKMLDETIGKVKDLLKERGFPTPEESV